MKQHPASLITATVCVGYAETRYTRGGTGEPVVILAADARSRSLLTYALAHQFRVIAPELPTPGAPDPERESRSEEGGVETADGSAVSRLVGFLDGLGLDRVTLIADEPFAASAIAFALLDPERAAAVVLTFSHSSEAAPTDGAVEGRLRAAAERNDLLAIWLDSGAADESVEPVLERVVEFLASSR